MSGRSAEWLADRVKDDHGRLFTAASRDEFQVFLRSRLSPATGTAAADTLLRSAVGPSKKLLDLAAAEIRDREQFILLDEQQVALSLVIRAVHRAREANSKQIVIVTGGPGSGKSVIALAILGDLSRIGYSVLHATGSRAFTLTLRKVAGSRAPRVQNMFKYFNNFIDSRKNELDVLVCDEAHRIRETSANRYTRAELRTGRSQTEELIDVARVPVFLLDEHQGVRPGEIGTVHELESVAQRVGIEVVRVSLDGQFRAGGSALYDTWVTRLLGLEPGGPLPWNHDEDRYSVRVADSPSALEHVLEQQLAQGFGARMTAGFCWRPTQTVFHRSGASTRRKGSNTTGTGSSSGPTSCGALAHGSPGPRPARTPWLPGDRRRRSSTAWSATCTRSCSPEGWSVPSSIRPTRKRRRFWRASSSQELCGGIFVMFVPGRRVMDLGRGAFRCDGCVAVV